MAANKKKRGRRQGLFSKISNALLIVFAFSRPLTVLMNSPNKAGVDLITEEATFGLSAGSFNLAAGMQIYGPAIGAVALGTLKSYLIRKFPVRG